MLCPKRAVKRYNRDELVKFWTKRSIQVVGFVAGQVKQARRVLALFFDINPSLVWFSSLVSIKSIIFFWTVKN